MGQSMDQARQVLMSDLGSTQQAPQPKPIIRKQTGLPKGVERIFTHKFDTSGNSLALYRIEGSDGTVTYRVTTKFADGTLVRDDLQKWELARKFKGKKPKGESNG